MKQIFILCLFVLLALNANGQSLNADSLVNVLNTRGLSVGEKLELYENICRVYIKSDTRKLEIYAGKGLKLAEKEKDAVSISFFYEMYARMYAAKSSLDTAAFYWNKMLNLAVKMRDRKRESRSYLGMANLNTYLGKRDVALEYLLKALSIYESLDDRESQAQVLRGIGAIHRALNNHDRAIYYFEKAKKMAEETNSQRILMEVYYELGAVCDKKGEYSKSLQYTQHALQLSRILGNQNIESACLGALSLIYCYAYKDYNQAEKYAKEALYLSEKNQDKFEIYGSLNDLSGVYCVAKRFKECEQTAYRAWQMDSTRIGNAGETVLYSIVYSNIHLGNKEKAVEFLTRLLDNTRRTNDKSIHESLTNMEVKYETEKKEIRIATLEKERQLYAWLGFASIMFALLLGVVLWLKIRNSQKERQIVASNAVQEGEMGERERIAGELHDRLLGSLSAVKSEIDNVDLGNKLNGCIEEVRRISRNLMPLPLRNGIKTALEDFTAQFPNVRFHFFGQEKRVEKRLEFVIYCCANELVTNSIRHSGAKNINVQLIQGESHIALTVQDDGCGFDEKTVVKGVGLKSVQDRVTSCCGKLNIFSFPNKGTETVIEINI